jgi:phosphoglycerol transferase MdoB-like AlkP superfamily enzyme
VLFEMSAARRYRLVFALATVCVAIGAVLRAVLWWRFGPRAGVSGWAFPAILAGGLLNDLVVTTYLLAPLVLYTSLLSDRWYHSRPNRWLLAAGSWLTLALLTYLAFVEVYFFEEFDARFNLVAFDYLAYPTEVAGDLWQEYPILRVALASAVFATVVFWTIRRFFSGRHLAGAPLAGRLQALLLYATAVVLLALFYPTDLVSLSSNRVANELVQNGTSSFFEAGASSEIDYHAYYSSADPDENLALLERELGRGGGQFTRLNEGRLDRIFPARADGLGKLNVVLVSSESFGAEFSRLYGSEQDLTPEFDALAQQGLWFSRTYASGTRTVRGLEAFASSIPPIPTVSILRRPGNEGIATWGAVMSSLGYHTSFLYGGYGYFDNMNYFFGNNGFELLDRSAIENVRFENIWGVSDEDLFDLSLSHFDQLQSSGKPFFSIIMTTSNHKPFTFRPGLEKLGIPEQGGGRAAGVRYADFALGEFLRNAQRHPWFNDTIFVVVADHGARVYGAEQIPLRTYEIPLMIYAPGHIKPQRVDTLMTQIDVAPTVLGLLGLPYEAPFFGQDVLSAPPEHRVAFFNHNHDVAIYRDGHLVVFGLKKTVGHFHYDPATNVYEPAPRDAGLERLGIAYFQTAYELFTAHQYEPSDAPDPALTAAQGAAGD